MISIKYVKIHFCITLSDHMHMSKQVMVKHDAYEKHQAPAHSLSLPPSALLEASQKCLISTNSIICRENLLLILWLDSNNVQTFFNVVKTTKDVEPLFI